ncbi:hypothetical protein BKX93_22610 [Chromobacterium vaccinii]|uniref:Uncharacterized protein n=1 Tax=Chromobacterium vaccinii TaxID=1108595 RepID=A0A1D9LMM2_9NEIS|nr:hypothetical protein BKX93_22610 [Chromobacterium vaccinii]
MSSKYTLLKFRKTTTKNFQIEDWKSFLMHQIENLQLLLMHTQKNLPFGRPQIASGWIGGLL